MKPRRLFYLRCLGVIFLLIMYLCMDFSVIPVRRARVMILEMKGQVREWQQNRHSIDSGQAAAPTPGPTPCVSGRAFSGSCFHSKPASTESCDNTKTWNASSDFCLFYRSDAGIVQITQNRWKQATIHAASTWQSCPMWIFLLKHINTPIWLVGTRYPPRPDALLTGSCLPLPAIASGFRGSGQTPRSNLPCRYWH